MYNCSNAFHAAVAAGNEQIALLLFMDCVFTDDDIVIDRSIEFDDNFNTNEDISIGQTPSNEIRFSLVNENRLLNNYDFGKFLATIGVYIGSGTYTKNTGETCRMVCGNNTYIGYSTYPYIKKNGTALSVQPSSAVYCILYHDWYVYVFYGNGNCMKYDETTGNRVNTTNGGLGPFMLNKSLSISGKGAIYMNNILNVWEDGEVRQYEFCPLGWFTADRPKAPDKIQIDMTCYDYMQLFEVDMTDLTLDFTYGQQTSTLSNFFIALCTAVGVQYQLPDPFINGNAKILSRPEDFDNATARDVLKWIGEASCSNARFNRDGRLVLDWIRTGTAQSEVFGANGYSDFDPYWYETKRIGKLYNRSTQDSRDYTRTSTNSGSESYLIQDNPFLRGVNG